MGLKLREVQHDAEFTPLFHCFRAAFTSPGTALWPLFTADYRPDPALRQAALEETTRRLISWHRSDPTSHWLRVVDDTTGEVVGGGRWSLYQSGNPYDGHGEMEADWWPAGAPRTLASDCLNQFLSTSARHMNRPHACEFLPNPHAQCIRGKCLAYAEMMPSFEYPVHASGASSQGRRLGDTEMGSGACRSAGSRVFHRGDQGGKAVL